jgi:hypothetical protein
MLLVQDAFIQVPPTADEEGSEGGSGEKSEIKGKEVKEAKHIGQIKYKIKTRAEKDRQVPAKPIESEATEKVKPRLRRPKSRRLPGHAHRAKTEVPFIQPAPQETQLAKDSNKENTPRRCSDNSCYWAAVEAIAHPAPKRNANGGKKKPRRFDLLNSNNEDRHDHQIDADSSLFSIQIG